MKVVFFGTDFTIFGSNAATNLLYAFASGFNELACKPILITMANEYANPKGRLGEIEYYIPFEQTIRENSFFKRNFQKILKYSNVWRFIQQNTRKEEATILICFTASFYIKWYAYLLRKLFFRHSFIFMVEHPLRDKKNPSKVLYSFHKFINSAFFDGQIFISEGLKKYFKTKKKNIVVPSMVLSGRFNRSQRKPYNFDYIAYCGTISRRKDGVDTLIIGFGKICSKFPLIKLLLIGDFADTVEKSSIKILIKELNLMERVVFTGQIEKDNMPFYLNNAQILALARPTNLQSETGFPTKLPEYLATGRPVVVTKVGDIPNYLNEENAYMVDANDADVISDAFEEILSNYEKALERGKKGRLLAETVFNPQFQARRVIDFIKELENS